MCQHISIMPSRPWPKSRHSTINSMIFIPTLFRLSCQRYSLCTGMILNAHPTTSAPNRPRHPLVCVFHKFLSRGKCRHHTLDVLNLEFDDCLRTPVSIRSRLVKDLRWLYSRLGILQAEAMSLDRRGNWDHRSLRQGCWVTSKWLAKAYQSNWGSLVLRFH